MGEEEDDEWQVMGPKNKGSMTRKTDFSKSPISEMFVGQMSSLLNRTNTPKTTTLQPFFTLQLDIQVNTDLRDSK
jgi:ubiquitin carboxyl-terminal hydrolase 10